MTLQGRAEQCFGNKIIGFLSGAVRSVKETLNSQFVENCKGVIQRLTLQEHKMVWNRTTHLWYVAFVRWLKPDRHLPPRQGV